MIKEKLFQAAQRGDVVLDYFVYNAVFPIATFIANANVTVNIPINADSDFLIDRTMLSSYSAAGVLVVDPDYTTTWFDTGSGRQLQDQATHVRNVFGTAQRPYILPEPKLLKGASVLQVSLINATAVAALASCSFSGYKVFYFGSYSRADLGIRY